MRRPAGGSAGFRAAGRSATTRRAAPPPCETAEQATATTRAATRCAARPAAAAGTRAGATAPAEDSTPRRRGATCGAPPRRPDAADEPARSTGAATTTGPAGGATMATPHQCRAEQEHNKGGVRDQPADHAERPVGHEFPNREQHAHDGERRRVRRPPRDALSGRLARRVTLRRLGGRRGGPLRGFRSPGGLGHLLRLPSSRCVLSDHCLMSVSCLVSDRLLVGR